VLLNADDIAFACKQLPLPPEAVADARAGGEDSPAGVGAEPSALGEQLRGLQQENAELRREVEVLRRQAEQGSDADVMNATMLPDPALQGTAGAELRGIQTLLKEVRRLRAEVQGRDEQLAKLNEDNVALAERLRKAEADACADRIAPGTPVQYFSGSLNRWIDAVVEAYKAGAYDLDVKKGVLPDRIRRRSLTAGGC
jgi:cell division protein FtsB